MIKTITLQRDRTGRLDDLQPFILPDDIAFEFKTESYNITNAYVLACNGQTEGKIKLDGVKLALPKEFLHAGILRLTVVVCDDNGGVINSWAVYPIHILENDGLKLYDELNDLERRIKALEDRLPKNIF